MISALWMSLCLAAVSQPDLGLKSETVAPYESAKAGEVIQLSIGDTQPAADAADVAVVCPPIFRAALEPWVAMRTRQNHRIAFIDNHQDAAGIRNSIQRIAESGQLKWVLLVGDVPSLDATPAMRARTIPTEYRKAEIIARWGPDRSIATDNYYADLNDDEAPDVAIGRLTADTPAELSTMVKKIVQYELSAPNETSRQQIHFVAGVSGFGPIIDTAIEYTTKSFLTDGIPPAYRTTMTYGSWRSPYCPDPRRFHEVTLQRLNEGSLFWVYIGHGQRRFLDQIRVPGGAFHILDVNDMPKLNAANGPSIAMFLACYTAAFDDARDCLSEEMLRSPGGPVAVLGGSRVTMPYALAVLGSGMMHEYFHESRGTLGELLMYAKRDMAIHSSTPNAEGANRRRQLLDTLATVISPNAKQLKEERLEHVALYHLLGDPLLSMRRPEPIELRMTGDAVPGELLNVQLTSPVDGVGVIELVCRRDSMKSTFAARQRFDATAEGLDAQHRAYHDANDHCWVTNRIKVQNSKGELSFLIPSEVTGPCFLRCYIRSDQHDAIGAIPIAVALKRVESGEGRADTQKMLETSQRTESREQTVKQMR